jgi:hypothetical protein
MAPDDAKRFSCMAQVRRLGQHHAAKREISGIAVLEYLLAAGKVCFEDLALGLDELGIEHPEFVAAPLVESTCGPDLMNETVFSLDQQ